MKQQYTTPSGYTYKFIPDHIDLSDKDLRYILDNAPKYKYYLSTQLTPRELQHLRDEFKLLLPGETGNDDPHQASLIFKHQELTVDIMKNPHCSKLTTLGIFANNVETTIDLMFARELGMGSTRAHQVGITKVLDYNWGGNMEPETIFAMELIIRG